MISRLRLISGNCPVTAAQAFRDAEPRKSDELPVYPKLLGVSNKKTTRGWGCSDAQSQRLNVSPGYSQSLLNFRT